MAFAGGRRQAVQPLDLFDAQLDVIGCRVLLDSGDTFGAGNRSNVVALREQPGQSGLCRCCSRLSGNGSDFIDDAQIPLKVLAGEARVRLAPVVVGELLRRADVSGKEPVAERPVDAEREPRRGQRGCAGGV